MASATVLIMIKSVVVENNGDTPDLYSKTVPPAHVGIVSALIYPNGIQAAGANSVVSSITIPMSNNTEVDFDLSDPYSKGTGPEIPLQFKILIDDQCPLNVELNYTDNPSLFGTVLAAVISTFGGTLASAVPGGSYVTAAVKGIISFLGDHLKDKSGKHIQPIGNGTLRVKVSELTAEPQEFTVPLTAPDDVFRSWFKPNPDPETKNNTPNIPDSGNVITKGQKNGQVVFEISTLS